MGIWQALTGGGSRWDADTPKPSKKQAARDLVGYRTTSRANHEALKQAEDARKELRKAKKQAAKAEGKFFY